jgi:myosin-5
MADTLSAGVSQALQVYIKGTKAWFIDDEEAWVSASFVSKEETPTKVKMTFVNDADEGRVRREDTCEKKKQAFETDSLLFFS